MDTGRVEFKLMTFNIEYGGTHVDFEKVKEVIRKANPHVVAIEEAFGNIPRLAKELGWEYFDTRLHLISQLPLRDPPEGEGIYTFVQIAPGKVIAICNVHLPNDPEGSFAVMKGASADEIIELEKRARMPYIEPHLKILSRLAAQGMPVFLAGDFNAPSHLDWTEEMIGVRAQIKFALDWPISKAVMEAGFHDSFRDLYPDPRSEPGLTWWAERPQVSGWNPNPNDPQDRIDFIYRMGSVDTLESVVIGEETVSPFPSDHRAVMSTFAVMPEKIPTMVTAEKRSMESGERLKAWVHGKGSSGERCVIALRDETTAVMSQLVEKENPEMEFSSHELKKGAYDLLLLDSDSTVLSRYPFWVKYAGEPVRVTLDKEVVSVSEPLTARWENTPGNRWDWVGIYKAGQDPMVDKTQRYMHTGASICGEHTFETSGMEPGKYEVLFCLDDNYICLARAAFEIKTDAD